MILFYLGKHIILYKACFKVSELYEHYVKLQCLFNIFERVLFFLMRYNDVLF